MGKFVEEVSVANMAPVVPLNSDKVGNSLSDTTVEEMISDTDKEIDNEQGDSIPSKVISRVFDSLDLDIVDDKKDVVEEGVDVEGLIWFEDVDWTMTESTKEIDDDIKGIIKMLNDKGYETKYSCSGHPSARVKKDVYRDGILNKKLYSTARIVFAKDYEFDSIPEGWEVKVLDEDKTGIYVKPPTFKIVDGLPTEAFYKWKKKYMSSLEKWAKDLPKFGEKPKDDSEVLESVLTDIILDTLD